MFLIPKEHILFTSELDLSQVSNKCYQTYNKKVQLYLETFKTLLKIFPKDIVHQIMKDQDPRKSVHKFSGHSGKVFKGNDCIVYDVCTRCYMKILFESTLDKSHQT